MKNEFAVYEQGNTLVVSEKRDGTWHTIMRVTAGAVTAVQREYFRANIIGRIKQVEADLILKYFYGLDTK